MSEPRKGLTIVIGQWIWASGETLAEAKREWQRRGGTLSRGYEVMAFDAETEFHGVDQMGSVHYRGNAPVHTVVKARARKS